MQPPDDRDPHAADPSPSPGEPPSAEAPTQAWAPASPPGEPATSPLISSEPAITPGPAVAWTMPGPPPEVGAPGLTWAGTGPRFVAYLLDTFLIFFVSVIVVSLLGFEQMPTPAGQAVDPRASQALSIVTTLLGGAYFILSWSGGRRATLGQRLFNIQVGNAFDGLALTMVQAIKRWVGLGSFLGLFAVVPSSAAYGAANAVEFVWAIVLLISTSTSPTKQGLHDRFANSAVVRPTGANSSLATACLFLIVAVLVLGLLSIVALIFLGGQVSAILSNVGESI